MNNNIRTYSDLIREKQEMEILLLAQKELITSDLRVLQSEIKSATSTLSWVGKLVSPNKKNILLNSGINKVIDLVLKKVVLARAGWITRFTVPLIVKNFSSHVVDEKKGKWLDKLFHWVRHKNGDGKVTPETFESPNE
jgi:hypothetical protein